MKRHLLILTLATLLITTSCNEFGNGLMGCGLPSQARINEAQSYMGTFNTSFVNIHPDQARKIFGCYYREGDAVYVYKNLFWGKDRHILVRYGRAIDVRPSSTF